MCAGATILGVDATNRRTSKTLRYCKFEVKFGEYSAKLKRKIHIAGFDILASVLIIFNIIERSDFCVDISYDGVLVFEAVRREGSMRISGKTRVRSSHDLFLIIGAVIAIAMIASKMVHNWRHYPPSLGMTSTAVRIADSGVVPHY
jgi:hypothetical protein